jgi:hypothetical protein
MALTRGKKGISVGEMLAPDQPCPGCGGTLYRMTTPAADITDITDITDPDATPGKVTRCSGRCELVDGVAGVTAAPRR